MLSVELKWHTNEQVQWPGDILYIRLMKSSLDIRHKPVPNYLPLDGYLDQLVQEYGPWHTDIPVGHEPCVIFMPVQKNYRVSITMR